MNPHKICAPLMAACIMAPLLSAAQSSAPQSSAPSQSSATQAAPPRKPITHQALWMMKRVGTPVVSPDGKWVVFSVLEPSYEPDKEASDLWLVPAGGGAAPRRITNTRAPENGTDSGPERALTDSRRCANEPPFARA